MASSMNEIKCVKSHFGFYPEHYFAEAIESDLSSLGLNGDQLKSLKKYLEPILIELFDHAGADVGHGEARTQAIDSIYKALGYFATEQDDAGLRQLELALEIGAKSYTYVLTKRFDLKGQGELWLVSHNSDVDKSLIGIDSDYEEALKSEHFIETPCVLKSRNQTSWRPWKDTIEAMFSLDAPSCEWLIINTGASLYLFERGRWESDKSYLELDLLELFSLNAEKYYKMAESLFSPKAFPIESAEFFHEKLAHNAHKKAAEVTKALRDTVRESIELIANEVLENHRKSKLPALAHFDLKNIEDQQKVADLLFDQSLRYVYRILFLLFTESQDQAKGALPVHSRPYQRGYALERIRDLEGVVSLSDQDPSSQGHFIHSTLKRSFKVYFEGYHNQRASGDNSRSTDALGFAFPALGTDLFDPKTTQTIEQANLRDTVMINVIRKISLAKTGSGKKARTYRVHYAGLGLNQLGAVYEGLLSLKPTILNEKSILLEKEPKDLAHRFIPYSKKSEVSDKIIAKDEDKKPITREAGEFLLAPVGLERKFSASFYTPEVLTRFVAKEAVDALLKDNITQERLENLKILEPAMGSGAFLNAVVDEIAPRLAKFYEAKDKTAREQYLDKIRKKEDREPNQDEFAAAPKVESLEFYKSMAKNHMMRNCVYGVDLNPTAVELAKVSLWLNCLHKDGNLPFLDFKLRLGNSLVGGWVTRHFDKDTGLPHWFLPNPEGLGPHLNGKILGDKNNPFISDISEVDRLKSIQRSFKEMRGDHGLRQELKSLHGRVAELYSKHLEMRLAFQKDVRECQDPKQKQALFEEYQKANTHYNQLRFAMDAWCALWFWPHSELSSYPNAKQFLKGVKWALTTELPYGERMTKAIEDSGIEWLTTARKVALEQKFFHYDLEFAEVFKEGGFDLVIGNPPWAPVRWEEADYFEMVVPGIHEPKGSARDYHNRYEKVFSAQQRHLASYKDARAKVEGLVEFLANSGTYPFADASNTNTYKYFYQRFYSATKPTGIHGMIAQDGILSDDGCLEMRPTMIKELVKSYRFVNELRLFEDVHPLVEFMVWFCVRGKQEVKFESIDNLYHPDTVAKCRQESGHSPYRGMKNDDGDLELRGHPKRMITWDFEVLRGLAAFEGQNDPLKGTLPIVHGQPELAILLTFAKQRSRLGKNCFYTQMFDETKASLAHKIVRKPGAPNSIESAVMTGPNVFVGNPANKKPNPGCRNNQDFSLIDLESVKADFFPDTVYQCTAKGLNSSEYNALTPWGEKHNSLYRIISRGMVSTTGARTLSSAIIPPGPSHIDAMCSLSFQDTNELVYTSGLFNSLIYDFFMRSFCGGTIGQGVYQMTPTLSKEQLAHPLVSALKVRALRLSCISTHYTQLWKDVFDESFTKFEVKSGFEPKLAYADLTNNWVRDTCIRNEKAREQALCEIDAIVAILFGLSKETLLNLYRSQFGVLQSNLQDLPNQVPKPDDYHFPRYAAMAAAYDQAMAFVNSSAEKDMKKTKASA